MQDEYSPYPKITGGDGINVEALTDGYRISATFTPPEVYRGYFAVIPYPNYYNVTPYRSVQVLDGRLPHEEALQSLAGYVFIDRINYSLKKENDNDEEKKLKIMTRRLRVPVQACPTLYVPHGHSTVFLRISASHSGGSADNIFPDVDGKVELAATYHILQQDPAVEEGTIDIALANVDCDPETGGFSVTQLNFGSPSGVIINYVGSNTMAFDSDSESEQSSSSESSSSSFSSSSSPFSSSSSSSSSLDSESNPESSDSGESSDSEPEIEPSDSGESSDSKPEVEPSDSGDSSGHEPEFESSVSDMPSDSGSAPSNGNNPPGGGYIFNKWYIVADCVRYLCHPTSGMDSYSAMIDFYADSGDAIGFPPRPQDPTATHPIVEWQGVVMLEGPFDRRSDVSQSQIDEYYNTRLGDSC
jgi:hypothetical protein